MEFNIERDVLLPVLQALSNIVDRRQGLPILSNVLFHLEKDSFLVTATDMEVELTVGDNSPLGVEGKLTMPARKLFDICRNLPVGSVLRFSTKNDHVSISSGKSRFVLAGLRAEDYPTMEIGENVMEFEVSSQSLAGIIENTKFAMARDDVRYYLNGLLLEISGKVLRAVATDGHRLALDETEVDVLESESRQLIVPVKGINELARLLQGEKESVRVEISANHVRIRGVNFCFTSKLIDGKFPDYRRVIPETSKTPAIAEREELKESLNRVSVLSNEKYHGVRIVLTSNTLRAMTSNSLQEKAEEEVEVDYQGDDLEIGFNISYLLEALSSIKQPKVLLSMLDTNTGCLILPEDEPKGKSNCQHVVMPMKL